MVHQMFGGGERDELAMEERDGWEIEERERDGWEMEERERVRGGGVRWWEIKERNVRV